MSTTICKSFCLIAVMMMLGCAARNADYEVGRSAWLRGDHQQAMRIYHSLALEGDPRAQLSLGGMYERGEGVSIDRVQAAKWYQRSFQTGQGYARTMAVEKLQQPDIKEALSDTGEGLQCPETLEYYHPQLRHKARGAVMIMLGSNGGFSTKLPEHIKEYGLEKAIQSQKDALSVEREYLKRYEGEIPRRIKEIYEDTIAAREELLNVLWCYEQPGATVEKAVSREAEITQIREVEERNVICLNKASYEPCGEAVKPTAVSSERSIHKPSRNSGNACLDAMGYAATGNLLLFEKYPNGFGDYVMNTLWLPLGMMATATTLAVTPVAMVVTPFNCKSSTATSSPYPSYGTAQGWKGEDYDGKDFLKSLPPEGRRSRNIYSDTPSRKSNLPSFSGPSPASK